MEADKIINHMKMYEAYHNRLTEIVNKLGLAPDIDTFIREHCAPHGWQTPYNDVDYRELVDICEGYAGQDIFPDEYLAIFFLRFGVAVKPARAKRSYTRLESSYPQPECFHFMEGSKMNKHYLYSMRTVICDPVCERARINRYLLYPGRVIGHDPNFICGMSRMDHFLDHSGIKTIITVAQQQPPEMEVYVVLDSSTHE